jgi:hypothetical protein
MLSEDEALDDFVDYLLWFGLIDDVRIYDQALSVEEISKPAR